VGAYRPFARQQLYFDRLLNNTVYQMHRVFPTAKTPNVGFYLTGASASMPFACLAVEEIPDQAMYGAQSNGQFFPRWYYEPVADNGLLDLGVESSMEVDGYRRLDAISDTAVTQFQRAYGAHLATDDIFNYVYGLLHSPEYRETYGADLKRMLPRIPLVVDPWPFVEAGHLLSDIHLNYETVTPYPLDGLDVEPVGDPFEYFRVEKMAPDKIRENGRLVADRMTIRYNSQISVSGIPEDAYRYMLGSRSAVDWIIDRYQMKTDKASGIVNDPNEWARELGDPRYILDLLARIVTVSVETVKIVDALPSLDIREQQ
jgi:predicted helicase